MSMTRSSHLRGLTAPSAVASAVPADTIGARVCARATPSAEAMERRLMAVAPGRRSGAPFHVQRRPLPEWVARRPRGRAAILLGGRPQAPTQDVAKGIHAVLEPNARLSPQ